MLQNNTKNFIHLHTLLAAQKLFCVHIFLQLHNLQLLNHLSTSMNFSSIEMYCLPDQIITCSKKVVVGFGQGHCRSIGSPLVADSCEQQNAFLHSHTKFKMDNHPKEVRLGFAGESESFDVKSMGDSESDQDEVENWELVSEVPDKRSAKEEQLQAQVNHIPLFHCCIQLYRCLKA